MTGVCKCDHSHTNVHLTFHRKTTLYEVQKLFEENVITAANHELVNALIGLHPSGCCLGPLNSAPTSDEFVWEKDKTCS